MKQILIIGAGGIGSFFIRELSQLILNNTKGTENLFPTIYDGDKVEEKNLRYQNFLIDDLDLYKAEVLGKRYMFNYNTSFIEDDKDLNKYDIIILAVDNGKIRDLIYKYCIKNNKYFIDMRSEGRAYAVYTSHKNNTLEFLQTTYDVNKPATSCQLKFELANNVVQLGNRIVAMVGLQVFLNKLRGEETPAMIINKI